MATTSNRSFAARAQTIPLRLTEEERSMLRVLEGALSVSEYTDKVDVLRGGGNRSSRITAQLVDTFAVLSGLMLAVRPQSRKLIQGRELADNAAWFERIFEVGRRHKIMNPDTMRSSYGKLMHLLQDAALPDICRIMGADFIGSVQTVAAELEDLGAADLLEHADLEVATRTVAPTKQAGAKRAAMERLCAQYGGGACDKARGARLERVLLSIGDDTALTDGHVEPVEEVLALLHANFGRAAPERGGHSLQISVGRSGARLSHSHASQYAYVEQTLLLWREILGNLSLMWSLTEADLLDGSGYRLRDTGQGPQRVSAAPQVSGFMQRVLSKLQAQANGKWVGSNAVHLGDNDTPNAMVWMDKYTQVPRILTPLIAAVRGLDNMEATPGLSDYVHARFGSAEECRKLMLADFFRHAFDGSGADNYYDAGSCIDGRLTSAWNWCSKLEKKPYFHVFMMTGFRGFDGSFQT